MKKLLILIFFLNQFLSYSQISTFDKDLEGWKVEGDAQNQTSAPGWFASGGNPLGFAFAKDDAVGGVWYWTAPQKFLGNKCNSYGKLMSFDLTTNNLNKAFNTSDIIIASPGNILYYDTKKNPNVTWTNYIVKLDETDDWRLNNLNGNTPTQAQFKKVLSNITAIKIRGEFNSGPDEGGLDNFILENDFTFSLDKDGNSIAKFGDYQATICGEDDVIINITDQDLGLNCQDINEVKVVFDKKYFPDLSNVTVVSKGIINPKLSLGQGAATNEYTIKRISALADSTDFIEALKKTQIAFKSKEQADTLIISIIAIPKSGCEITRTTTIYNLKKTMFGKDTISTYVCSNGDPVDLKNLIKKYTAIPGTWTPFTASKNTIFDPKKDRTGNFFFFTNTIGNCPTDSIKVRVNLQEVPSKILPIEAVICIDSSLILDVSKFGFDKNIWQNSIDSKQFTVSQAGKYYVKLEKNGCFSRDSIEINTKNCNICDFYVPNSFSPNDDGFNDYFEVFSECNRVDAFEILIYDKWGNEIFESKEISENWNGKYKNIPANIGVYTYYLKTTTDFNGKPLVQTKKGDFSLIR